MNLRIKSLNKNVKEMYLNHGHFHDGDAGIDLFIVEKQTIKSGETSLIHLGIACENIEQKPYLLMPRSSISKTPLRLCNSIGLIDAGYRGEIMAAVDNIKDVSYTVDVGDRLFQLVAMDGSSISFSLVGELSSSDRGEGGFGSTGDTLTVEANESGLISIVLNSEPEDEVIYASIESSTDPNASILLKITIVQGGDQRSAHVAEGQNLDVHYKVTIYDTGVVLDEGDLPVTAGEDSRYITGFGWGQVGLDADFFYRGNTGDGTTHTVLLPPDLAYKNRDDRPEANNHWLQFELSLTRLYL